MKNFIMLLLFVVCAQITFASGTCNPPEDSAVIYFGNGINTTSASAHASLNRLMQELGSEYNGQKLEYAVSYNQTGGIAVDLLQSELQFSAQFDSQVMLWLNGIGLIPDKFAAWYQSYVMRVVTVVADEVAEHAAHYLTDILDGKKVVVVSHSQGNFYVNEAKTLLAKQARNGKIRSFAIFGVATPANNVGGETGPYLTNHRDFIQHVPFSLPVNWKLSRNDRTIADDVGVVQAHLFNATYISKDFDIKPQLISGIKAQIDTAEKPAYRCETYVKDVLSMVAGRYVMTCGFKPNTRNREVLITSGGMTFPEDGWADLTGINALATLSYDPRNSGPNASKDPIALMTAGGGGAAGALWDINGLYQGPGGGFCRVDKETPPTFLEKLPRISDLAIPPLTGIYRLLPKYSCVYPSVQTAYNEKPLDFSVSASGVRLGEKFWQIGGGRELIIAATNGSAYGYEPGSFTDPFYIYESENGNVSVSIAYARNREILSFTGVEKDKSMVTCFFERPSSKVAAQDGLKS